MITEYAQRMAEFGKNIIPQLSDMTLIPEEQLKAFWQEVVDDAFEEGECPDLNLFILVALGRDI